MKKKYALIVEDDPQRIAWFRAQLEGRLFDVADLAEKGIYLLKKTQYKMIFLDHDLGTKMSGFDVAKKIHTTSNKNSTVIVHSMNPIGAENMVKFMKSNGVKDAHTARFGTFVIN